MTFTMDLPKSGKNKTYYSQKMREFRKKLNEERGTKKVFEGVLSSGKEQFEKLVGHFRIWAKAVQIQHYERDNYGTTCCIDLVRACHWAHHDDREYPTLHTDVNVEHMDRTLKLMRRLRKYLIYSEVVDLDDDFSDDDDESLVGAMNDLGV